MQRKECPSSSFQKLLTSYSPLPQDDFAAVMDQWKSMWFTLPFIDVNKFANLIYIFYSIQRIKIPYDSYTKHCDYKSTYAKLTTQSINTSLHGILWYAKIALLLYEYTTLTNWVEIELANAYHTLTIFPNIWNVFDGYFREFHSYDTATHLGPVKLTHMQSHS